jgi:hypothetical protein
MLVGAVLQCITAKTLQVILGRVDSDSGYGGSVLICRVPMIL